MSKLVTYTSGYIPCSRAACEYRSDVGKCLLSAAECSRQRAQPKTTYAAQVAKLDASITELQALQAARKPAPTPKAPPAFVRRLAPSREAR